MRCLTVAAADGLYLAGHNLIPTHNTVLAAALGACAFGGPMAVPRGQIVIVASSLGQARITFNHTRWFLKKAMARHPRRWRLIENSHECRLEDRKTGTGLRALGSDPKRAHGLAPLLAIADEPAMWPSNFGAKMYAALETALGKQPNGRLIAIGTRSDDADHWFSRLLKGGPGIYAQCHAAGDDADDFVWSSVQAANPALRHMPGLREAIRREREKARRRRQCPCYVPGAAA